MEAGEERICLLIVLEEAKAHQGKAEWLLRTHVEHGTAVGKWAMNTDVRIGHS